MQLDLTRYRQPLSHFAETFQPEEVAQEGDAYRIVAPVELEFDIHKDKDRFRLVGTVRTELELPCSRCLEPFRLPVDAVVRPALSAGVGRCRPTASARSRKTISRPASTRTTRST